MKVLTKQLKNELDLHEIQCALSSKDKRTMPVLFLNGNSEGVADCDIISVKTNLNVTEKENELKFMILPSTFTFFDNYLLDDGEEPHTPENDFLSQYVNRLRIISCLPEEILKQVKDKRLLALGYAEKKVKKEIIKYAKAKKLAALKILEKSIGDSFEAVKGLTIENQFTNHEYFNSMVELFEEATVTSVRKKANDLYIELDKEDTFVLTDAERLEEEINPENTSVELFELYKTEQGYELHFLLMKKDSNFVENFYYLTYRFKDMMFAE